MDTSKMREQFEAWVLRDYPNQNMRRFNNGEYCSTTVEHCWLSWQASREAVVVELPNVVGFEGAYDSHRHHEFVPSMSDVEDADEIFGLCRRVEAKEAIEAQGLKVAP
ncbi:hypothetical protein [Pseudomonas putida]|uniref:hypothetical protein n=1 Tax=Pseudomonas putida TaxID=303 RepID=UPI002117FC94|nr:hypothetical protein [Pseudomonas putida]